MWMDGIFNFSFPPLFSKCLQTLEIRGFGAAKGEERWKGGGSPRGGVRQRGGASSTIGTTPLVSQRHQFDFYSFYLLRTPSEAFIGAEWNEKGLHPRINHHVRSFGIEKKIPKSAGKNKPEVV